MTKKPVNNLRKKGRRQRNLCEALLVETSPGNQTGVFAWSCVLHAITHTSVKVQVVTPATWVALVLHRSVLPQAALRFAC